MAKIAVYAYAYAVVIQQSSDELRELEKDSHVGEVHLMAVLTGHGILLTEDQSAVIMLTCQSVRLMNPSEREDGLK